MLYIILMHISCFMVFFANKLLLAVYFICILDYGNDIRQKANFDIRWHEKQFSFSSSKGVKFKK